MQSMAFNVPAQNMGLLEKKLKTLNKKAKKAGTGELKLIIIGETAEKDEDLGYVNIIKHVVVEGEPPRIAGWTFVSRLDHNVDPTGQSNLVYTMPGQDLPAALRNSPAHCEHCGWQRKRRDTYFLRNDATAELKQVGRTCVQDFIGIDPEKVLAHAERLRSLYDAAKKAESEPLDPTNMNDHRYIDLEEYLTWVAVVLRVHGWVSRSREYNEQDQYGDSVKSTARRASDYMFPYPNYARLFDNVDGRPTASKADQELAHDAIAWAAALDKNKDDFTHNMVTIASIPYIDWKATGTAAFIVEGYRRHLESKKPKADLSNSKWFAQVGDKIRGDVEITYKKILEMKPWDQFQRTLFHMLTKDGNLVVTFSTGQFNPEIGDKVKIRGTVKKLDTFNNVKQTIVNRVQIVN